MLDGAVSEPVSTLSAILAGGGFATDAMFIMLVKPCDTLARELPDAEMCLFVDDLAVHIVGEESRVVGQLSLAMDRSIEILEGDMRLIEGQTWEAWHRCEVKGQDARHRLHVRENRCQICAEEQSHKCRLEKKQICPSWQESSQQTGESWRCTSYAVWFLRIWHA